MAAQIAIEAFEEGFNGVHFVAAAANVGNLGNNRYQWVQTVITNKPDTKKGKGNEFVDQGVGTFPDPFYFRNPVGPFPNNKFEDNPHREEPPPAGETIVWDATLTLVAAESSKKVIIANDIRTYGFRLTLMSGTHFTAEVHLVPAKQDWGALQKHISIVNRFYPTWDFLDRFR